MEGKCEASPRGQAVGQQGTQGWATQCSAERASERQRQDQAASGTTGLEGPGTRD